MAADGSWDGFAGPVGDAAGDDAARAGGGDEDTVTAWGVRLRRSEEEHARLEHLEQEIVEAASHVTAATHRFLAALREFDALNGWEPWGSRSIADWLSWRTGMSIGVAREHVRVARALGRLPVLDEALRTAKISFSKARALTRVATPENESELLFTALCTTASELERISRRFRNVAIDQVEGRIAALRQENRFLRFRRLDDGFVQINVKLPPEEAAEVLGVLDACCRKAHEAAREAARACAASVGGGESEGAGADEGGVVDAGEGGAGAADENATARGAPSQRGGTVEAEDRDTDDPAVMRVRPNRPPVWISAEEAEERSTFNRVDALLAVCRAFREAPVFASGRLPTCEVFVEVTRETLSGVSDEPALLADGTALTPETARRLACDAAIVQVEKDRDGNVLDVGRRTRSVPAAIARALRLRDETCRFPGCANTWSLDAHNIEHWAEGGATSLDNLVRLCGYHHKCLHEGFTVERQEGRLVFRDPRGRVIEKAPPFGEDGLPGPELLAWLHEHGPAPGEALPIPIGGPRDWGLWMDGMLRVTYGPGDPRQAGPKLPDRHGRAPTNGH